MPQLGETVTEGTIVRWAKQVGDAVAADEVLFEVSTDKVDTEVPSEYAGVLRAIYVPEGDTVPIGTLLAVLTDTADEPLDEAPGAATPSAPPADAPPPPAEPAPPPAEAPPSSAPPAASPSAAPPPPAAAPQPQVSVSRSHPVAVSDQDLGNGGRGGNGGGGVLSPVVRRLLAEHGLEPGQVVGSGADGRITRADVLAAAANRVAAAAAPAPAPAPAAASGVAAPPATTAPSTGALPVPQPRPGDEVVPMSRARRMTAENLVASIRTSVHTLVATQVDYERLEPVRKAARLSYLPFVARAVVDALRDFPHLNASVGDGELHVHPTVNLGIAVDVGFEALVVPVVHAAADLRLRALASAIAGVAEKARTKRLTADDLTGGTFTITNVGAYGTTVTSPVITQPQVAILSTDGVRMTPVAVPDGDGGWAVAVHPVGGLSLTFDHRAVDGAYASAFLARVRDTLQDRDWEAER
jgi:pyruvate dehydrogenase E2 component (dihydrolipoamide acetyltransferase)